MKYTVVLEKDENGTYVATVPALPGCISEGETIEEALINIKDPIQGYIEDLIADKEEIPKDIELIEKVEVNA
jgi:predicted RNase H-like HicB family nuclease